MAALPLLYSAYCCQAWVRYLIIERKSITYIGFACGRLAVFLTPDYNILGHWKIGLKLQ
uniref:Uncharacterized protein n=1 Tax=Rhizophora mucronata TaxID=61149 RepID=A0A2P2NMA8_RHIMU